MIGVSLNELTTFRWSFDEDVEHCAALGVAGLGVWRQKLSDVGVEAARELLRVHAIRVSHLAWAGGFTGDGWSFREAVNDALDSLFLAGQIEAGGLLLHSGGRLGHTRNHARQLFLEALGILLPVAESFGVPLLIEPHHAGCRRDVTWLHGVDDFLRLKAEIPSSWLRMVFDTYHLGFGEDIIGRIPEIAAHVGLVQIADGRIPPDGEENRCMPGEGTVPLREIIDAFLSAGYRNWFDVELMGQDMDPIAYADRVEYVASLSRQLTGHGRRAVPEEGAKPAS